MGQYEEDKLNAEALMAGNDTGEELIMLTPETFNELIEERQASYEREAILARRRKLAESIYTRAVITGGTTRIKDELRRKALATDSILAAEAFEDAWMDMYPEERK